MAQKKYLVWIDNENGEVTKRRKSPKTGNAYEIFFELYRIKQFLTHPNLRFKIVLIDLAEYRNLDGWSKDKKKGTTNGDRVGGIFDPDLRYGTGFVIGDYSQRSDVRLEGVGRRR